MGQPRNGSIKQVSVSARPSDGDGCFPLVSLLLRATVVTKFHVSFSNRANRGTNFEDFNEENAPPLAGKNTDPGYETALCCDEFRGIQGPASLSCIFRFIHIMKIGNAKRIYGYLRTAQKNLSFIQYEPRT
jgi:hypothetical protein